MHPDVCTLVLPWLFAIVHHCARCAPAILQQCTLSDNHRQGVVTANSHVTAMSLLHHRLGVAGGLLLPHLSPYTRSTSWSDRVEAGPRRLSDPNPEHAGKLTTHKDRDMHKNFNFFTGKLNVLASLFLSEVTRVIRLTFFWILDLLIHLISDVFTGLTYLRIRWRDGLTVVDVLQVLPEILGDDVQLPRVLLGLLRLAGLRDGAGEELERGGLGPPAGHQVGGSPRLRVLRGLGLLPRHRAGPGQCMCVSLRHKDVSQGSPRLHWEDQDGDPAQRAQWQQLPQPRGERLRPHQQGRGQGERLEAKLWFIYLTILSNTQIELTGHREQSGLYSAQS